MIPRRLAIWTCCTLVACSQPPEGPPAIRLVDLFPQATVEGPAGEAEPAEGANWRFDGEAAGDATGWQAGNEVAGLTLRDGRLVGRSTADFPLVHVERTAGFDDQDLLHAVEVRLSVSAGANLSMSFAGDEELDLGPILERAAIFPWSTKTSLEPGDEVRTYTLRPGSEVSAAGTRHVLLRPTDAEGADFAIESVRLIFRQEHLAASPAAVGWHGMSNIYRESITARDAQTVRFSLTLPSRPWLDLALASIEDGPVTFIATIERGEERRVVLQRTVSTANRWEPLAVDLADFAGQDVELILSSSAHRPGSSAFWGSPVVRNRIATANGERSRPQGVVLIVGDTVRSDHLSAWGHSRTTAPVLTSLAAGGMRAADCITQATWTKVSVPSILTARYPLSHGVRQFTDRLPASAVTLAEIFRDAGYATLGLSSIAFTGKMTNLHQGYEEFHEAASLPRDRNSKTARLYVDRLTTWIESHRDAPFFVFLHVADPHSPYVPYPPYDTLWGEPGDNQEYVRQQDEVRPFIQDPLMQRFGMPARQELVEAGLDPERYVGYELDAYDSSIRAMDLEIGRLLERLRELGLDRDTLIAFISDHGTEFLDHDRHFHGHSVYGELNRVPMLLNGPGVPAGVVIQQTVQTLDLMPTLLEVAGIEAPPGMQGQSLVPWFGNVEPNQARPRPAFTEKAFTGDGDGPRPDPTEAYSIVLDGWKLIHNVRGPDDAPEFELYDHNADPLNHNNLAEAHAQRVEQLAAQLTAWRESAAADKLASDSELTEGMNEEDLERLRSLGYVQ